MKSEPKFGKRSLVLAAALLLLAAFLPATLAASAGPAVVATINLGANADATAFALAVNPNTNKTYVTPGLELTSPQLRVPHRLGHRQFDERGVESRHDRP